MKPNGVTAGNDRDRDRHRIGGDLNAVTGKRCTFMCFPWRWKDGDGCGIRILAVIDPEQKFRFEAGA